MARESIEVLLEREASPKEVAAVEQAMREAGIDATVRAAYERRGVGDFPWILQISGAAASIFFAGFLAAAGADAWKALKALIVKLYEARASSRAPKGVVILIDEATHEWILIRDDLPDEAWQLLLTIEIPKTKSSQLRWDFKAKAWRETWEIEE